MRRLLPSRQWTCGTCPGTLPPGSVAWDSRALFAFPISQTATFACSATTRRTTAKAGASFPAVPTLALVPLKNIFLRRSKFTNSLPVLGGLGCQTDGPITVVTRNNRKDDAFIGSGAAVDRLYVRVNEYEALWRNVARYHKTGGHTVLTGNSGIGKSISALNYLAMRSLKERPKVPVLFLHPMGATLLAWDGTKTRRYDHDNVYLFRSPDQSRLLLAFVRSIGKKMSNGTEKPQLLLLHDCVPQRLPFQGEYIDELRRTFTVCCVLAASPKKDNYNEFLKLGGCWSQIHCLPTWSRDEMKVIAKREATKISGKHFDDRFTVVGGIPRLFLSNTTNAVITRAQQIALKNAAVNPKVLLGTELAAETTTQLVQLVPSTSHDICCGWPISESVRLNLHAAFARFEKEYVLGHLQSLQCTKLSSALADLFEDYFLTHCLPTMKRILVRRLSSPTSSPSGTSSPPYLVLELYAESHKPIGIDNIENLKKQRFRRNSQCTGLYRRMTSNFPFIDAVLITNTTRKSASLSLTLFRVTVGKTHSPTINEVQKVLNVLSRAGNCDMKLVWVVEDTAKLNSRQDILENDKRAKCNPKQVKKISADYDAIPQYLLKVPINVPAVRLSAKNKVATLLEVHPEWIGLGADWRSKIADAKPKVLAFVKVNICNGATTIDFDDGLLIWIYSS